MRYIDVCQKMAKDRYGRLLQYKEDKERGDVSLEYVPGRYVDFCKKAAVNRYSRLINPREVNLLLEALEEVSQWANG